MAPTEQTPLLQEQDAPIANPEGEAPQPRGTFARRLGALDGFALLISIVIGSGVFSSPGPVDANVPSPGAALLVWLLGGVLAWTGALTMAELGTAFPGEGGIQPYLSYIYGEVFGFMAAWSWIVATMPATLAILSIVFVESIYSSFGVNEPEPPTTHKLLSLLVLVVVSTANSISTKTSTRLSSFFVAIKLLTIFLLIVAGLTAVFVYLGGHRDLGGGDWHEKGWFEPRSTVNPDGSLLDWRGVSAWQSLGFYSTALYGALWAYSGWDKVGSFFRVWGMQLMWHHRQTTSPLSSGTRGNSFHSLSTLPSRLSSFATSLPMQFTTSYYPGSWFLRLMLRLW
jgi:L-type amino acid transporter 9